MTLQFLTEEESAAVDAALLTTPEKFLTRLTLSTGKLLLYIAKDIGTTVEALNNEQIIAWFEADSKRKQTEGIEASVLKWDAKDLADLPVD
ncbi:MAG: hypothetical protein ACFB16_26150 [Phormidesmis sp.]